MKKKLAYLYPIFFLIGLILLTWILFFSFEIVTDNEKRLTGVVALLGLGFGIFHFWMNEINIDRRRNYDFRNEAFKEIVSLIKSVSETINDKMISKEIIEVHGLVSKLMNQINNIGLTMNIYNESLFPGIYDTYESKKIEEILTKILLRTDKFRISIEKASDHEKYNMKEFVESVERMNWHNEMKENLEDLNQKKYDLYRKLRSYF